MSDPEWEAELAKIDARVQKAKDDATAQHRALLDGMRALRDYYYAGPTDTATGSENVIAARKRMWAAFQTYLAAGGRLDE